MGYDIQDYFKEANWISQTDLEDAYRRWSALFDQKSKSIKYLGPYREALLSIYEPFLKWIKVNRKAPDKLIKIARSRWFVYVHSAGVNVPLILQDLRYPQSDKFNPPIQYFRISNNDVELLERLRLTDDDPNPDEDRAFKCDLNNQINRGEENHSDILQLSEEPSRTPLNGWSESEEKIVISLPKMSFMNTSVVLSPPLLLAVIDWSASKESLIASIEKLKALAYFPSDVGRRSGFTPKISDFEQLLIGQINSNRKPKDKIEFSAKTDSTPRMRFANIISFIDPAGAKVKPVRPSSPKSRINSMQKRYVK